MIEIMPVETVKMFYHFFAVAEQCLNCIFFMAMETEEFFSLFVKQDRHKSLSLNIPLALPLNPATTKLDLVISFC